MEADSSLFRLRRSLEAAARQPSVAREVGHRPWPPPGSPWVLAQTWIDTCFLHWPVDPLALRPAVPRELPIQTFDGAAWVTISPLLIRASRPRLVPPLLPWAEFPEVNLRTYTTVGGKPGIYFLSLECASALTVAAGRAVYRVPYRRARMTWRREGARTAVTSSRVRPGALPARIAASYEPLGEPFRAAPGSLEAWLLERYCCYAVDRLIGVLRAEIHHPPWRVHPAEARIDHNSLASAHGLTLEGEPLVHVCPRQDVLFWPPRRVRRHH